MKKTYLFTIFFVSLWVAFIFCISPASGSEKIYLMSGTIKAIDQAHNTVVIECPLAGKRFTVGGPMSAGAVLKKGSRSASLSDFSEGERVDVKWRSTEKGHVIEMMKSR
ncbi:MAG: hypothetical protein JSV31_10150 [Desulfobacterales bacterium]|nr:MAG: hypothetical protein JSV31_10150 [Desulfobacterales bacterium]